MARQYEIDDAQWGAGAAGRLAAHGIVKFMRIRLEV